jgi:hypothetical protein
MKIYELLEIIEDLDQNFTIKIYTRNKIAIYQSDGSLLGFIDFKQKEIVENDCDGP